MSEEESEKMEEKTHEEKMEEMREKLKQMYGKGEPEGGLEGMPRGLGSSSLMSRMASMSGSGQQGLQSKAAIETFKKLRGDAKEIKEYLKEILMVLKKQEK